MKYVSTFEAAKKWNISARRIAVLCSQDRIEGAQKAGNNWIIPEEAAGSSRQTLRNRPMPASKAGNISNRR